MDILNDIELDEEVKSKLTEAFTQSLNARLEEETKGLKSKVDELLGEKKRAKKAQEEAEAKAAAEAQEKAMAENNYQQLFESQKAETEKYKKSLEEMNQSILKQKINGEAAKIALTLTKDAKKAELLQEKISARLTLVDNEIRVADESGQLTVSTLEELTNNVKSAYPFLVDGSQASGSGATRTQASGERSKQLTRADFEAMSQSDRSRFFASGGRLID